MTANYPVEVKLSKPVDSHGEKIDKLIFKEATGKVLMGLALKTEEDGSFVMPNLYLASSMANVPPSTIESLCEEDALKVMGLVGPLAVRCLGTLAT